MAKSARGLFDAEFRLRKLDSIGDPLKKLDAMIDWRIFRPLLLKGFMNDTSAKGPGGRPPYDLLVRFKVLLLQSLYNLSDDAMEYQINDRRTFQRFIGLEESDNIPDAKTIWVWRETLTRKKVFEKLFKKFNVYMEKNGIKTNSGSIVDASFVDSPKQRNTREENNDIKNGKIPDEWEKPEKAAMFRQKDTDARWTKKNNEKHYGYKSHIKVDTKTKLVKKVIVTNASVHDSQAIEDLLDKTDAHKTVYGDSAYSGQAQIGSIKKVKAIPRINEKGYRNKPLTKAQMKRNRGLSKTRARVEHVFGFMTMSMGGMFIRCVGIARAEAAIIMKTLAYNMRRYCTISIS